jgi:tight adherence protein C
MMPTISLPMLVAVVAFCSICLCMMGIYHYLQVLKKKRALLGKIKESSAYWTPAAGTVDQGEEGTGFGAKLAQALSFMGQKASKGISDKEYSAAKLKFVRAGIRHPNIVPMFWGIKTLVCVVFVLVFMFLELQFYFLLSTTYTMGGALAAALVGLYLPDFWLRIKRSKRANSLERGFPDTLDLLVVCVEAGMGLDGAINRVSKEIKLSNPALSDEFRLYTLEVKAGKSRQEALNNLGIRTDLEDVKNFVGLLVQTIRFGTSMADTLRIYSDTFRTKRRQRAEEKAAKLPVKMIFPCFLFIFPAMFVVILGPAVIQLFETLIK